MYKVWSLEIVVAVSVYCDLALFGFLKQIIIKFVNRVILLSIGYHDQKFIPIYIFYKNRSRENNFERKIILIQNVVTNIK